jgi:hypothetical protein
LQQENAAQLEIGGFILGPGLHDFAEDRSRVVRLTQPQQSVSQMITRDRIIGSQRERGEKLLGSRLELTLVQRGQPSTVVGFQ